MKYRSPYDQFWDAVEAHPSSLVRRILPTKGKRWGDLTPAQKYDHRVALDVLNGKRGDA